MGRRAPSAVTEREDEMPSSQRSCSVDERRRGVVSAIVSEGGGQQRPYSDLTTVVEFFPGQDSLPDLVLEAIGEGIRVRCWCDAFGPVATDVTVGQLQNRVYRQHRRQGGPKQQDGSPVECCT